MCYTSRAAISFLFVVLLGAGTVSAQDVLTQGERQVLLERVKRNLVAEQALEDAYTYSERARSFTTNRAGQRAMKGERVYEVYPGLDGGRLYRRLMATDGRPTPPAELEKQDRKRREEVTAFVRKRARESPRQREQRERKEAARRREDAATIDEAFRLLDVRLTGRTTLDGRPVLQAEFAPRPGVKARSREGKILQKFRGRAFVDEADAEIVRVELEAIDNVTFGWGLLAKVNRGSRGEFERRRVNDEVWLPASFRLKASGRQLLVRGLRVDTEVEWYDYRKFTVSTAETIRQ